MLVKSGLDHQVARIEDGDPSTPSRACEGRTALSYPNVGKVRRITASDWHGDREQHYHGLGLNKGGKRRGGKPSGKDSGVKMATISSFDKDYRLPVQYVNQEVQNIFNT